MCDGLMSLRLRGGHGTPPPLGDDLQSLPDPLSAPCNRFSTARTATETAVQPPVTVLEPSLEAPPPSSAALSTALCLCTAAQSAGGAGGTAFHGPCGGGGGEGQGWGPPASRSSLVPRWPMPYQTAPGGAPRAAPPSPVGPERPSWALFGAVAAAMALPLLFGASAGFTSPVFADCARGRHPNAMNCELKLTPPQKSLFAALINAGALAGALTGGLVLDPHGRRRLMIAAAALFVVAWTCITSAPEPAATATAAHWGLLAVLYAGRLLSGVAIGFTCCVVNVYVAEVAPAALRGALGTLFQVLRPPLDGVVGASGTGSWEGCPSQTAQGDGPVSRPSGPSDLPDPCQTPASSPTGKAPQSQKSVGWLEFSIFPVG